MIFLKHVHCTLINFIFTINNMRIYSVSLTTHHFQSQACQFSDSIEKIKKKNITFVNQSPNHYQPNWFLGSELHWCRLKVDPISINFCAQLTKHHSKFHTEA